MRRFLYALLVIFTATISICYAVSCFSPFISPLHFWPMLLLVLGYPYLALCFFLTVLVWLSINRTVALVLSIILLAGAQNLSTLFAFHPNTISDQTTKGDALRVLGWNVRGFDNPERQADTPASVRRQMFSYINNTAPDILCLEEFAEHIGPDLRSNTSALEKLGYKYFYKPEEIVRISPTDSAFLGTAIFSKIPFTGCGEVLLGDTTFPEHLIFVDILYKDRPLRIFATHLKSFNLFATPADSGYHVRFHGDEQIVYSASKLDKLKAFSTDHVRQSAIVKDELNRSRIPFIFAADLNSLPASFPYHRIATNLSDAFLKKGFGLGGTFSALSSTLRIDYLLCSKQVQVINYHKDNLVLSDHYPHFADFAWQQ